MSLSVIWRNEGSVVAVPGQREPLRSSWACREVSTAVSSATFSASARPYSVFWAHPALE